MRILVIDDDASIRKTTIVFLISAGHEAVSAATASEALQHLAEARFDAALLDLRLGATNGLDLLPELRTAQPDLPVVVFTAYAAVETAVEAMRRGATDYVPKPFTPEQIRQVLARIERTRRLEGKVAELESELAAESPAAECVSEEPALQKVLEVAWKAAATPASVLILGASGTGKSVLARAIHARSPQRERAFVIINCPGLPRDLLESELFGHARGAFTGATSDRWGKVAAADGGTLFLDEIGELGLELQPKLLRLLHDREYERVGDTRVHRANVRIIAATNRNLEQAVAAGRFREDLYYRLNVITLVMPPLRERPADLHGLAQRFLRHFSAQTGKRIHGFTPEAEAVLGGYPWPGNVRELRNVIERAVILAEGEQIDAPALPEKLGRTRDVDVHLGADVALDRLAEEHARRVLARVPSLEAAARILGIDPATLYRKRKRWGW